MSNQECSNFPKYLSPRSSPTVLPSKFFLSSEDVEVLKKAMKGMGTNEKAIINVVAKRSNAQRLEIISQFQKLHSHDLVKELKSELSGNFRNLIEALLTPLPKFYAEELHHAMNGPGTDEHVLIEVLCSLSNHEIVGIKHAYHETYHKSLESDIQDDTSGNFKSLLVSLCKTERDECSPANPFGAAAAADAEKLYEAGEKQWGTDESTFKKILCHRSFPQLRLIFEEYERLAGHDIETAIKSEFSGDIKDGLLAIVNCVRNKPAFFAKRLYKSIKGLGTSDRDLIRLVVTRCEIDMGEIKEQYKANYGKSLADAIKDDTSGDYRNCLLTLIGEE